MLGFRQTLNKNDGTHTAKTICAPPLGNGGSASCAPRREDLSRELHSAAACSCRTSTPLHCPSIACVTHPSPQKNEKNKCDIWRFNTWRHFSPNAQSMGLGAGIVPIGCLCATWPKTGGNPFKKLNQVCAAPYRMVWIHSANDVLVPSARWIRSKTSASTAQQIRPITPKGPV